MIAGNGSVVENALRDPFYYHGLNSIPAWVSSYIPYNMWDENIPFPNFSCAAVEFREWISNFIPHFIGHVVTYPCWN